VTRKLAPLGCQELQRRSDGSHWKLFNPNTQCVTSVPDWGNRDLKLGTVRAIIRQLGVDWGDFENA
jgi:predicted RNA binding protein YcfA (HicA-like mRNA interferase family)